MDTESFCRVCRKDVHCCIFERGNGFTFVGLQDARRIRKKTGQDFDSFLDFSPLPEKIVKKLEDEDPALEGYLRFGQLVERKRLLRLKKKADGRCIFLNDSRRCEIYDTRPKICKIFPFWAMRLEDKKLKVIEHDSEPGCMIAKKMQADGGLDLVMEGEDRKAIIRLFKEIEKEDIEYRKGIKGFVSSFQS
jgi:Fe-S-cluster containining protein